MRVHPSPMVLPAFDPVFIWYLTGTHSRTLRNPVLALLDLLAASMPLRRLPRRLVSRRGGRSDTKAIVSPVMALFGGMLVPHFAYYVYKKFQSRPLEHNSLVADIAASAVPTTPNNFGGNDECSLLSKAFQECLDHSGNDIMKCHFLMSVLAECRRNCGC